MKHIITPEMQKQFEERIEKGKEEDKIKALIEFYKTMGGDLHEDLHKDLPELAKAYLKRTNRNGLYPGMTMEQLGDRADWIFKK